MNKKNRRVIFMIHGKKQIRVRTRCDRLGVDEFGRFS